MDFSVVIQPERYHVSGKSNDAFNLTHACLPNAMALLGDEATRRFKKTIKPTLERTGSLSISDQILMANSLLQVLDDIKAVITIAKLGARKVGELSGVQAAKASYEGSISNIRDQVAELQKAFKPDPILNRIGFSNLAILRYLEGVDEAMMSDVAKAAGHSTAAATGSVDRLERFPCCGSSVALVKRSYHADDRRKVYVSITEHGKLIAIQSRVQELMEQIAG